MGNRITVVRFLIERRLLDLCSNLGETGGKDSKLNQMDG